MHVILLSLAVPTDPAGKNAHQLAVLRTEEALAQLLGGASALRPPLVLQQYVPHGDCLFKVRARHPIAQAPHHNWYYAAPASGQTALCASSHCCLEIEPLSAALDICVRKAS